MAGKKSHPRFRVPNLSAKGRSRVKDRWRKQRGVDNKLRVEIKGHGNKPKIGYKNSKNFRFRRSDGTIEVLVHNEKELMALSNIKDTHVARIAHGVSARKRAELYRIAKLNGIKIVNVIQ